MIRQRMTFYGRVQGVGFRWKAHHLADALGLTGWVYNEYDGSVRMEVQGEQALIDRMVQELSQDRYIDIQDVQVRKIPVEEDARGFHICDR